MDHHKPSQETNTPHRNGRNHTPVSTPDDKAVLLTSFLHGVANPLSTILFGSRARGNHRPDSDIDILIVTKSKLDDRVTENLKHFADDVAARLYRQEMKVQIVNVSLQEFRDEAAYINSMSTLAMLEGTTFSQHMELFTSAYNSDNPPQPAYDWDTYRTNLRNAKTQLSVIQAIVDLSLLSALPNSLFKEAYVRNFPHYTEDKRREAVLTRTPAVMRGYLTATIAATGSPPKNKATMVELAEHLKELLPQEDLNTTIPIQVYQDLSANPPPDYRALVKTLADDAVKLRKIAMRTKRRTAATANTSTLQPRQVKTAREKRKYKRYLTGKTLLPIGSDPPDLSAAPVLTEYLPEHLRNKPLDDIFREAVQQHLDTEDYRQYMKADALWQQDLSRYTDKAVRELGLTYSQWLVECGMDLRNDPPTPFLRIRNFVHQEQHIYTTEQLQDMIAHPAAMNRIKSWKQAPALQRETLLAVINEHLEYVATLDE